MRDGLFGDPVNDPDPESPLKRTHTLSLLFFLRSSFLYSFQDDFHGTCSGHIHEPRLLICCSMSGYGCKWLTKFMDCIGWT